MDQPVIYNLTILFSTLVSVIKEELFMVSMRILDVKTFMSELLIHDMFDLFLLSELEIITNIKIQVDGHLYKEYYSNDEKEALVGRSHSLWKEVKPTVYSLIKGDKLPLSMKIVLMLPAKSIEKLLEKSSVFLNPSDINGLYLNIKFENNDLIYTTGTSIKVFSLDKSLDQLWDERAKAFMRQKGIAVEEL